jgi:hypothetical protein
MTAEPSEDPIDELLRLAGVSTGNLAARRWIETALDVARGTREPQLSATCVPRPTPATQNAPLDKIERASGKLIAAVEQLRRHPYSHASFWRFAAFGPVYDDRFERPDVMRTLKNIRDAARKARVSRTGRPRNVRKQQIVDLALVFCARFSPERPSSDVNNFFPPFAERFFQLATDPSARGTPNGVDRQIRQALKRLPIEKERAALLNESRRK